MSSPIEKLVTYSPGSNDAEKVDATSVDGEGEVKPARVDKHAERRALWKVDLVVIPVVGMYCACRYCDEVESALTRVVDFWGVCTLDVLL